MVNRQALHSIILDLGAVQALAKMGPAASSAASRLGELLLHDSDPKIGKNADKALGPLGDESAIPTLTEAIGDSDRSVRRPVGNSLHVFGETPIPALFHALGHENGLVRGNAETFILYRAEAARPGIEDALEHARDDEREAARTRAKDLLAQINQR